MPYYPIVQTRVNKLNNSRINAIYVVDSTCPTTTKKKKKKLVDQSSFFKDLNDLCLYKHIFLLNNRLSI